jgi:hypothetical protein
MFKSQRRKQMYIIENILPLTKEQYELLETNGVEYYPGINGELEFDSEKECKKAKELLGVHTIKDK